jgi:GNAT superfamily N-acetyltransferase
MQPVESVDDLEPQLANSRDYWAGWGRVGAEVTDQDVVVFSSSMSDPRLNGVLRTRNTPAEQLITDVRAKVGSRPWMWWVGPDSDPQLQDQLIALGAVEVATMPVMAVDLDRVPDVNLPSGLVVEELQTSEALEEWVGVWSPLLGVDPGDRDAVIAAETGRELLPGEIKRFAGRVGGPIVSTSEVFFNRGVAGIYVVTTVEDQQRRGIGTQMVLAAVKAARANGYRVATLQSSAAGQPVYERLGFSTVATLRLFTV